MTRRSRDEIAEEVEFLTSCGLSPQTIVQRLDSTAGAIARALYRLGMPELARPYDRIRRGEQRAAGRAA